MSFGGLTRVTPGYYAVVECGEHVQNDNLNAEIFTAIEKEVMPIGDSTFGHKHYLAEVDAFVSTAAVTPNLGGKQNAYFELQQRSIWKCDFKKWLDELHLDIDMENLPISVPKRKNPNLLISDLCGIEKLHL